jgi:ribokinase
VSARPLVVVVGSVNTDLVVTVERLPAPGETVTGGTFTRHGGGKGANQAVAAARAGAEVRFVGAVGNDDLGAEAIALLDREGIDTSGIERRSDAPTGVALIVVDARGENQIAVASGANACLGAEAVGRALGDRLAAGGVWLANLEIGDDAVLAGARAAKTAGMQLVLNPAPARRVPDELLDLGPILTPNEGEAELLSGAGGTDAAARALAARTGSAVIVTLGAAGALLCDAGELDRYDAFAVEATDTTGAGDAFTGALAARLAAGAPLREALPFALAGAALAVAATGAREGMASEASIRALLER